MTITKQLTAPLFASWQDQYAIISIAGLSVGAPVTLRLDGQAVPFQYTGSSSDDGAQVMLRLGFEKGQTRTLEFQPAASSATDLSPVQLEEAAGATIGYGGGRLAIPPLEHEADGVPGPLAGFGEFPLQSRICGDFALCSRSLTRLNDGPLFMDYLLEHQFEDNHYYAMRFRCYRHAALVEVAESFFLGMNSRLELTLNPRRQFDRILSHGSFDFEGEVPQKIEELDRARPKDVLCRLQMPPLGEYTVPNNRGWFALFDSRDDESGMLGIMGLYGQRWVHPVDNMPEVKVCAGTAQWQAALGSGERFWLLVHSPVETTGTPDKPFLFHRLHGQFNALRLDEHLDLTGGAVYDAHCWDRPGFFDTDYRERARRNAVEIPPLRLTVEQDSNSSLQLLLEAAPERTRAVHQSMLDRFEKWVRDFQGYREGKNDYAKNVIGFSRRLRDLLLDYEILRKDGSLTEAQVGELHAYFSFAARRIMDEGRWPHSKTHLHPDHPDSVRDIYTYNGEHKPDRLIWTNSLPNFQSDPLCALAHLAALIPEHPDAGLWQRKALDGIEDQLNAYCSPSGAWEESINYAIYTLIYFTVTFRIVRNRLGVDYLQDERMRRFTGWLARFFGPLDKRFNAYTFPGIGNSSVPMLDGGVLLCFASELAGDDPLRADLLALYQRMAPSMPQLSNPSALMVATMAQPPTQDFPLLPLASEHMQDLGVAMRHDHPAPDQSYLFQKIGFWKDHYENDETALNWYAKGTPLVMEYGTYTPDAAGADAHNLVEIPDMDGLRRGYLAASQFSPVVDYTRCEVPITLKLLHGRLRTFEEIDGPPQPPLFFYLGDDNPLGPKTWKTRLLLFVKPDYLVLFDRVRGPVPHRYNLHVVADSIERHDSLLVAPGRFDLDLHCFVQHPRQFRMETGQLSPTRGPAGDDAKNPHRQSFFRLYNEDDGTYRTVLFARERERPVKMQRLGEHGIQIVTPEYTDHVFASDEIITEAVGDIRFSGRTGWIRRQADGAVLACMLDGDLIAGHGLCLTGRGPWTYNMDGQRTITIEGVPREIRVTATP